MIVDRINQYLSVNNLKIDDYIAGQIGILAKWTFQRQFMENAEDKTGVLRLSGAGKCPRQQAYKFHGIEKKGKEIDSRAKIIFWQGDLVEMMMLTLARLAGCNIMATGLNQLTVIIPIQKGDEIVEVLGHPDGILLADKTYLVECKSMASYSFDRFERGDIDEGYIMQCNMYMQALKLPACVIVAMNKDNGVLSERIIQIDPAIVSEGIRNLETCLNSTIDKLPEPKYNANEKGIYPWQCLYCAYWGHCKEDAEKILISGRYQLKRKELKHEKENNRMVDSAVSAGLPFALKSKKEERGKK